MSVASQVMPGKPYYEFCAETLEEFRVALGIERWAILAYSTGTRASEAYLQRYPQQVTRAVFLCPIYLTRPWMMTIQVGQWLDAHHAELASWFLSGWRLYGWLLLVGFNLHRRNNARAWMSEMERRPLDHLKRMLLELPGRGRAPFTLPDAPPVPSLFVWARHDLLVAHPARPRPNDVFIFASHGGAPLLTPETVAAVVVPFLKGTYISSQNITEGDKQKRVRFKVPKLLSQVDRSKALHETVTPSRH